MIIEEKEVGKRIRKMRKLKGMTQEQLAKETGLSVMSIRRYESAERSPSMSVYKKIADVLDTSTNFLISGLTDEEVATQYEQHKKVEEQIREKQLHNYKEFQEDWKMRKDAAISSVDALNPVEQEALFTIIESLAGKERTDDE